MWKRTDDPQVSPGTSVADVPPTTANTTAPASRQASPPRPSSGQPARLGPSLSLEGKLAGDEDLVVDGRFRGEIHVPSHMVTVGGDGKIEGEVHASSIVVEGEVRGNLVATEQVLVRASGKVHGDIRAPRVALDQGCRFKGAIDMEPQAAQTRPADLPSQRRERENERSSERGSERQPTANRQPAAVTS